MKPRFTFAAVLLACATALFACVNPAFTQTVSKNAPTIPNFFDPQDRLIRPSLKERLRLRFLTVTDFPPFSFIDRQNRLAGFHVELARAVCRELELEAQCQIQALPYGELESALNSGAGEAILAGIPIDAASRERFSFTVPYFHIPARFVGKADGTIREPLNSSLSGRTVGIVDGTAHAAYAKAKFGDIRLRLFETQERALATLEKEEIAAVFSDAVSLGFWLQQKGSIPDKGGGCCDFVGDPYISQTYFGRGLAIAVQKDDLELTDGLNFALKSINAKGKFAELYLRYFPISLY